jgi:hypothetical protein
MVNRKILLETLVEQKSISLFSEMCFLKRYYLERFKFVVQNGDFSIICIHPSRIKTQNFEIGQSWDIKKQTKTN